MEETINKYVTDTQILSFAGSGNIFLCDDYALKLQVIIHDERIVIPSIRHGVLWWKTEDKLLKEKILRTLLPADLKDLEQQISAAYYWDKEFVIDAITKFTYVKFLVYPDLRNKFTATYPKKLKNGLMEGQRRLDIDEINDEENTYGNILMEVREKFL